MALRELALFAGAGGGILGGHLLGWNTVCAVEIEKYPREILLQRQRDGILPRFPIWDDICTFDGRPWKGLVDIVSGGFPCQDISAAGKGVGITGERSGLWKEMSRVVCEVRPRFVLVENSPMLTSRGLDTVLGDLAEMGYDARWCVLGACEAGAPHERDRIWILAHTDGYADSTNKTEERKKKSISKKYRETGYSRRTNRTGINPEILAYSQFKGLERFPRNEANRRESGWNYQEQNRSTGSGGICWWDTDPAEVVDTENPDRRRADDTENSRGRTEETGRSNQPGTRAEHRSTQPRLGRVAHGVAHRVDRLKAIGNGQVSAVAAIAFIILSGGLI